MSAPELILIGAGGHARACIDVVEDTGDFRIAGLVGLPSEIGAKHLGYAVIGTDGDLLEIHRTCRYALIAVGQIRTSHFRERLYQQVLALGFEFPTVVARDAHVSRSAMIGEGTIVMRGAILNAAATVGQNCIINSGALIEHDATVADHCHISTGAILNGQVYVGAGSFLGSGTAVMQGVSIGRNCVVGMGCTVRRNLPNGASYVGERHHD